MPIYQKSLAAADDIPITAANFPAAAIVFDFESMPVGAYESGFSIDNLVSPLKLEVAAGAYLREVGGTAFLGVTHSTILSGTIPQIGDKHCVAFQIGHSNSGLGSGLNHLGNNPTSATPGLRLHSSAGTCAISDGTVTPIQTATMADGDGTTLQAHMCIWERGVTARASDWNGSVWSDKTPVDISTVGAIVLPEALGVGADSNPALLVWMYFEDLPSDTFLKTAVKWSFDHYKVHGIKALYPGLAGRV